MTGLAIASRRGLTDRQRRNVWAYLFIAPFLLLFVTMLLVPLLYAGYLSLFRVQLIGGDAFVGLENYARAMTDPRFLGGLGRMALFLVIQVPIMLVLALAAARAGAEKRPSCGHCRRGALCQRRVTAGQGSL